MESIKENTIKRGKHFGLVRVEVMFLIIQVRLGREACESWKKLMEEEVGGGVKKNEATMNGKESCYHLREAENFQCMGFSLKLSFQNETMASGYIPVEMPLTSSPLTMF